MHSSAGPAGAIFAAMKMIPLLSAVLALSAAYLVAAEPATESQPLEVPLEAWVQRVTIDSARVTEDNCVHIERGAKMNFVGDLAWMPKLNGYTGILVVHPFSPKRPALIEMPVTAADAGKFVKIAARGSDNEPGGVLHFMNGEVDLGQVEINSEWVETAIRIPAGATMITLAWHAAGWYNEQIWVDSVSIVPSLPKAD